MKQCRLIRGGEGFHGKQGLEGEAEMRHGPKLIEESVALVN
jgi:hypothetical protein